MTAPIIRLARLTRADSGRCSCCGDEAVVWYRTGIIADGRLTVAARYCAAHDPDAGGTGQRLGELTVRDVARLSPGRVRRARRKAIAARETAAAHWRVSASLRGASSATHTYALLAACAAAEADTLLRLAGAL